MSLNVIKEYLASIGFKVDEASVKKTEAKLEQMRKKFEKAFNPEKMKALAAAVTKIGLAFAALETAAVSAMTAFITQTVKADMAAQIFARRMMITVANARSLKAVMSSMGLHSMEDLKDVLMNPELRQQFISLRNLTTSLEPGAGYKQGVDNFRQIGYQLQKLRVLSTYFFQYTIGALGKILEGPLKQLTKILQYWVDTFKANISNWANQLAVGFAYFLKISEFLGRIVEDVGKLLLDMGFAAKLPQWLKLIADLLILIELIADKLIQKLDAFFNRMPPVLRRALGSAAIGAMVGGKVGGPEGALAGAGIGAGAGLLTSKGAPLWAKIGGGATAGAAIGMFVGPEGAAIGGGIGAAVPIGIAIAQHLFGHHPQTSSAMQKLLDAQALHESGSGSHLSLLARKYHNYFGVKGAGPAGSVVLPTGEYAKNGIPYMTNARFAIYHSKMESYAAQLHRLTTGRYANVGAAKTFEDKAWALQHDHYATDPNYANEIIKAGTHISININGAQHPTAVADAVVDKLRTALNIRQHQGIFA